MDNNKLKKIYSVTIGAMAAIVFITIITIAADLYLPLKGWLANNFSHHWIGKGVLSIIVFVVFGAAARILPIESDEEKVAKILKCLVWLTIFGTLAIIGFFVWEALLK